MSKIIYHKYCRQHEAVSKVKRMLNKIEKQFGGFQGTFYCNIQLTGVYELDRREVRMYIENYLKELQRKIDKQILQNQKLVNGEWNESYEEGYYMPPLLEQMQIVEALNEVHSYISNYPEPEPKKDVFEFSNVATHPEEKKREYIRHYEIHPLNGFNKTFFRIYPNEVKRELFPLTADVNDLKEAIGIETVYH